jgi:hypothetical protein
MRRPSVGSPAASRVEEIVCPDCGCGWLQPRGFLSRLAECDRCGRAFDKTIVGTLEQIVALPRALGKHPCECGHPEMRRLPDGVFHCPACRAEVLPASNRVPRTVAARRLFGPFERIPPGSGAPEEEVRSLRVDALADLDLRLRSAAHRATAIQRVGEARTQAAMSSRKGEKSRRGIRIEVHRRREKGVERSHGGY